jgi:hypothetical protein
MFQRREAVRARHQRNRSKLGRSEDVNPHAKEKTFEAAGLV